jgi:hypothetical protein
VKTNRQLGLQVPNGFRPKSSIQQKFILHTPPMKSAATIDSLSRSPPSLVSKLEELSTTPIHSNRTSSHQESIDTTVDFVHVDSSFIPIVISVDKSSSLLPHKISMTEDYLRSCISFCRVDTLKKNLACLYQPTITLDHTPPDAILDPGYYATLCKKDCNTTPVPRPEKFGDVIHIDIVFGPKIAIGNVHYGLLCVDRYSHMTYLYPLQNLTDDIQKQLESFFAHLGIVPRRIISDFDLKLVGGQARQYLNSLLVHVNAAPSYHQIRMV